MARFNVEYKISKVSPEGTEVKQVKKVTDDLPGIINSVQEATAAGGGLEYLTIRRLPEPKPVPVKAEVKK